MRMDESQDHKQFPNFMGCPKRMLWDEPVPKRGSSLHITSLWELPRTCLKAKPFSQGPRHPKEEGVC